MLLQVFSLPLKNPVLIFSLILFIILLTPVLLQRLRIPDLIGLIIAGAVIGPNGVGIMERDSSIELFGTVGLLYIMFIAGLEIDMADLKKNYGKTLTFGLYTFLIPMIVGTLTGVYWLDFSWPTSILLASMYASHTLITYPIVSKYGITKNRAVSIAIGGTVITCILALLVLAVIVGMSTGEINQQFWIKLGVSSLVFISIVVILFPFKMQASETKQTFILYTPYTKISVPPGESISYSIDVINNSDEVKNATLALAGLPKSWSYEMKAGGWTLDEIAVLPGEKKNFTLKVDVPLKVNKGTYHFTIGADGLARLPLAITVSKQGTYRTEFTTTQPNMQGNSKSTFTFNATLKNQTAEQQLYALMAEAPRGWNVIFKANYKQATSAQVAPNASENISVDITAPSNVKAGTYKIPVIATTGSTSAQLEFEVVITGSYRIELTTPQGLLSKDITAGDTRKLELVVLNTGSAELKDIQLSANKPIDWEVSFEPSKLDRLAPGDKANVTAVLKASRQALPGDYVTKITARAPEADTTTDFRISVKTPMITGWIGVVVILAALGAVYYLFRKYGRR